MMLWRIFFVLVLIVCTLTGVFIWVVGDQGLKPEYFSKYKTANVTFDQWGIPTIQADTWEKVVEAQGFVTASERLWQMDLMRRKISGRLAEWFGEKLLDHDIKQKQMAYEFFAEKVKLPADQQLYCDAYARGVNDFIQRRPNAWGLEYSILREKPQHWSCKDTLLMMFLIAEDLTGEYENDLLRMEWQAKLPQDWFDFLFKSHHPWASPTLGKETRQKGWPKEVLSWKRTIDAEEFEFLPTSGSNAWVYQDGESYFLANDTHLAYSVPQIWYALRLKLSDEQWVVGASVPGIFGVASGMTPHFAFAVTNLYDDVDNVIEETIGDDDLYLASRGQKQPLWLPVVERTHTIQVKSQNPHSVVSRHTHRGPLVEYKGRFFSRQWLAFQENAIAIPAIALAQAKNWQEFNTVLDENLVPSFAWLYAGNDGTLGFRGTSADVKKKSITPMSIEDYEWPKDLKPRKKLAVHLKKSNKRKFLVAANHKHWDAVENFAAEDRQYRIREILSAMYAPSREDMEMMQMDAHVPFYRLLETWLKKHDQHSCLNQHEMKNELFEAIETKLLSLIIANLRAHYGIEDKYVSRRYRSWLMRVFLEDKWQALFGVDPKALALDICTDLSIRENSMDVQHPFVETIPLLGRLFQVPKYRQVGSKSAIQATRPRNGPVFRMVWDLQNPARSSWIFPVGQSGHVRSPHYRDLNRLWQKDERIPALNWESQDTEH
jgi:penicillin G amidase